MEKNIIPYFGDKKMSAITQKDMNEWILNLPGNAGISASTANKMLSMLNQMLRVAVYEGYIPSSPAENVRPLYENEKRRGTFTPEEIMKLFSSSWDNPNAYIAAFTAAFTGMRLGEIRALRKSRIMDDSILVDSSWSDKAGIKCTKSGKERVVPITRRMHSMLMQVSSGMGDDELVFSRDGKTPYEDRRFSLPLRKAMAKAGIDYKGRNITFHSFRHFFNTQVVAAGISGDIVRNIVGHESVEMTDRYLHLDSPELDSVRKLQFDLTRGIRRDRI